MYNCEEGTAFVFAFASVCAFEFEFEFEFEFGFAFVFAFVFCNVGQVSKGEQLGCAVVSRAGARASSWQGRSPHIPGNRPKTFPRGFVWKLIWICSETIAVFVQIQSSTCLR